MTKPESTPERYRIGAVARLTGVPPVTLRAWERRYGAVRTERQAGRARMYTREDVERLALIKRLVDLGNAVSTVATLSLPELQRRLQRDGVQAAGGSGAGILKAAVLGIALPTRLRYGGGAPAGIELIVAEDRPADFAAAVRRARPDVVIFEYPTVHDDTVQEIEALLSASGAPRGVVVYGFARRAVVASMDRLPVALLRAPIGLAELGRACRVPPAEKPGPGTPGAERVHAEIREVGAAPSSPPRFSAADLERLAASSPSVACECPRHLSELVSALSAFELYCAQCVELAPQDADLHAWLHATTGQAREIIEIALERVARHDGLI